MKVEYAASVEDLDDAGAAADKERSADGFERYETDDDVDGDGDVKTRNRISDATKKTERRRSNVDGEFDSAASDILTCGRNALPDLEEEELK